MWALPHAIRPPFLACGSAANLHVVPGMADYAFPLKNIADAIALRSHIMEEMEKAEVLLNLELRRLHLTFIVVGGGYSGVEVAGGNKRTRPQQHALLQEFPQRRCSQLCSFTPANNSCLKSPLTSGNSLPES